MKNTLKNILSISPYILYQNYRDKKTLADRINKQKSIIDVYIKTNEVKKLQIGCGANILKGWLNTDLNYTNNIAFLDAGGKFPIESDTFDYVYSEHLFEHLKIEQQINMLQECKRILKKGGVMRTATPSLEFLFKLFSNPGSIENKNYINWAVKNIPHLRIVNNTIIDEEEHYAYVINNFFKAWGHQMIHNYSSFKKLAIQSGFKQVYHSNVGDSAYPVLRNIEKHGTVIPANINLIETMVIEITK